MRSPIRTIVFVILLVVAYVLFHQARAAWGVTDEEGARVDGGKIILLFGGIVVVGVIIAILFVTTIMPQIAEGLGNLFFNPNEQIEKNPHAEAMAAVARGEYEEAIEAYQAIYEKRPQ